MITISGIMFGTKKIGIALRKMSDGDNDFEINVTNVNGERLYPGTFTINKEEAVNRYGISIINKKNLQGIWVPLADLKRQVEINKNLALAQEEMAKKQEADARGRKLMAIQDAEGAAQAVKINADAERYKLEQEAAGQLAKYKADAEGKRLQAEALGGGKNVVALKFAETLPSTFKTFVVPVGQTTTSLFDINGLTKGLFSDEAK